MIYNWFQNNEIWILIKFQLEVKKHRWKATLKVRKKLAGAVFCRLSSRVVTTKTEPFFLLFIAAGCNKIIQSFWFASSRPKPWTYWNWPCPNVSTTPITTEAMVSIFWFYRLLIFGARISRANNSSIHASLYAWRKA